MNRIARLAAVAATPLAGACLMPFTAHAAQNLGSIEYDGGCTADGWVWMVDYSNTTGEVRLVEVWVNGVLMSGQNVPAGQGFEQSWPGVEGDWSALEITVDGQYLDGDKEFVDCKPDQAPTASIEIVCPTAENPDEDIFVRYTMTVLGDSAEFTYSDLAGAQDGTEFVSDGTEELTFKVSEGEIVDAWISAGQQTLATMIDTVHCEPIVVEEDVPTTDDSAGSGAGSPTLPQTGGRAALAVTAAALCGVGAALAGFARRRRPA